MSASRDTWTKDPAAYHRQSEAKEAAKFLANQCRRFLAEKANTQDVEDGIAIWRAANPKPPAKD